MSHDHGHHKETFITKYIFSLDHKMIAKQYLISGLLMGIVGVVLSLFFRMQIAWPEESFEVFKIFLGDNFASVACTFFQASCRSYGFGKVLISEAYKLNARSSSGFYLPEEARRISGRGLPSWPKARDLRSRLAGVRGFESRTPHHCYRISSFLTFL